ncbi:MMPL family transporter [Staphylococcus massiliensis]|uniref:MMPL family transporter n=1 Tax=Staphylococcus massiliensis TaxID=555791 RepID=UPI001EDEFA8B|nr:MMPL family transporter [Staphylococcus massiliensis]MCG3402409.1 MMPL family transporter [Staphylococcus massiliensis]
MKTILKFRWVISLIVVVLIACSLIFAPNLSDLANQQGEVKPSKDMTSQQYKEVLKDAGAKVNSNSAIIELKEPLSKDNKQDIRDYVKDMEDIKEVDNVLSPLENKDTEDALVSDDKKTIMIPYKTNDSKDETLAAKKKVQQLNQDFKKVHLTGDTIIHDDITQITNDGLKKTEIITVILILAILFAVFRSVTTPFIPLFIVGLSYAFAKAVLALLIEYFNFPVSIYIQPFLVALLFGIGTDYCILILNRYKEELPKHNSVNDAVAHTFNRGGRTILICAATVLVGFSALFFVKFSLFRSAVGIAIGVICLIIVMFTIMPLIMSLLGTKTFWPNKNKQNHKDNKLWGRLGNFTTKRPFITLVIVLAVSLPFVLFAPNKISYNNTHEVSDDVASIKALNIVKDKFGMGKSFPLQIAIKDDDKLTTKKGVNDLEILSKNIEDVDGVKKVSTITRPSGDPVKELTATYQLNEMKKGLNKTNNGVTKVNDGLGKMNEQMSQAQSSPQSGNPQAQAQQLSQGLQKSQDGLDKVDKGQTKISDRLSDMSQDESMNQSGMYITDDMLKNKDLNKAIDMYSEDDGKILKLDIELEDDPFSKEAIQTVKNVKHEVSTVTDSGSFKDSRFEYGGVSSQNNDLQQMVNNDMNKAIFLIISFLFVILVIFKRSIIMPAYMVASILLTYYTAMGVSNIIFDTFIDKSGLLYVVPFFSFVVLMALGIDYAIFLLDRFNEEVKANGINNALLVSMKKMGTVIMTACIILIGTVAALYASGALTLMQIATVVIIGLILYNILMLPLFIPALVTTFGKANWWPFKYKDN